MKVPLERFPWEHTIKMSHVFENYATEQCVGTNQPFCLCGDLYESAPVQAAVSNCDPCTLLIEIKSNIDVGSDEPPNLGVDLSKAQRLRKKRGCRGGKPRAAASYSSPSHANH